MNKIWIYILLCTLLSACSTNRKSAEATSTPASPAPLPAPVRPKNIILMIGDGMGLSQVSAGLYMNQNHLHLEQFPVIGLHKSYAYDNLITDSAAGATAFACGIKTYNGAVGMGPDTLPRKTILEKAEDNGLATGLIATSTIVHATPACFIAHSKDRNSYEDIAADFLKTNIDLFIGGGKKFFDNRSTDHRNLYAELSNKGYYVSDYSREIFEMILLPEKQNFAFFTSDDQPLPASQGRDYLPLASRMGVEFLKERSKKGFFLMVEGSQIDWGGHDNNADYIISEMLDFDQAIGQVLEFAKNDGETLVIVTADHETGGFSINEGSKMGSLSTAFTTKHHTGTLIPVFAFGPGADEFAGIYENTAIYDKMKKLLGL